MGPGFDPSNRRRPGAEDRKKEQAAADDESATHLAAMECQPFERYEYVMLLFRNDQDFQRACELLGIEKVQITYPGGMKKIGLGRCIDGARAIDRLAAGQGGGT